MWHYFVLIYIISSEIPDVVIARYCNEVTTRSVNNNQQPFHQNHRNISSQFQVYYLLPPPEKEGLLYYRAAILLSIVTNPVYHGH